VINLSLDDGSLAVSNMLNDTTSNNEQITVYTAEYRDGKATTVDEIGTLYEDLLDLSEEDEITIRWVAANLLVKQL
jgi:hypothetical protein